MDNPLVLLVLLAIAAGVAYAYLRQRGGATGSRTSLPPREDDLRTLGLSEVRPRSTSPDDSASARSAVTAAAEPDDEPPPSPRSDEGRRRPPAPGATSTPVEPADRRAAHAPEDLESDDSEGVEGVRARPASAPRSAIAGVAPLLDSLRSSLGARGVALLRFDEINDGYEVVGRAGEGFGGNFNFPAPGNALHRVPADGSISLLDADTFGALRYHVRPEATVGHAAALAVEAGVRHLLVADRGLDDGPFAAPQLDLLGEYADLVGRLLGAVGGRPAPGEPGPLPAAADSKKRKPRAGDATLTDLFAPQPAAGPAGEGSDAGEPEEAPKALPQRRAILAEEIGNARAAGRPLAFALVTRRGTEEDEGSEAANEAIEEELRTRLEGVDGTERVERFGDALMGAFGYFGAGEAEEWAERVAAAGEPVHIGVALLTDEHGPEDLRGDAAAALHDAYERDETCVILSEE